MFTEELTLKKLKTQHYGIKHRTHRVSSLNVYWQSVCTIFRSNLDTRSLIGLCIENSMMRTYQMNNVVMDMVNPSKYRCAF